MSCTSPPLLFRRTGFIVAWLIDAERIPASWPVAPGLRALGFTRSTAYRMQDDYRRWLELGAP